MNLRDRLPVLVSLLTISVVAIGCNVQGTDSTLDSGFRPGLSPTATSFDQTFIFDSTSKYQLSSSNIEFTNGSAELTPSAQTDNSDATAGFGGGTPIGTVWDGTNNDVRLDHAGSATDLELDPSWTPAWSSLLGYWKLDEAVNSATVADASGNGNTGTPHSGVTLGAAGKLNTGAAFAGSATSYILLNSRINLTGDFTIAAWANFTGSISNNQVIVGNNINYDDVNFYAGLIRVWFSTANYAVSNTVTTAGTWHHHVITCTGTTVNIYIDGVNVTTAPNTFPASHTLSVNELGGSTVDALYSTGTIDDVAIWNTGLSAAAIATIYQHESAKFAGTYTSRVMDGIIPAPAPSWTNINMTTSLPYEKELPDGGTSESPTGYSSQSPNLMTDIQGLWHLDEPSTATTAVDHSGNGNDGTFVSSPKFGVPGEFQTAVLLDGTASAIATSANLTLNYSSITNSVWFRTSKATGDVKLTANYNTAPLGVFSGKLRTCFGACTSGTTNVADGNWHFAVVVGDNASIRVYLDGNTTPEITAAASVGSSTHTFLMGATCTTTTCSTYTNFFSGSIDEVALWSRPLSTAEIVELYRRGANRIRYQVRSCPDNICSTNPAWLGPDGTNQTFFSELNNNAIQKDGGDLTASDSVQAALPILTFANFGTPLTTNLTTNRYFQYRAIMESDDNGTNCNYGAGYTATWCSPELQSVMVGPPHYDSSAPTIINKTGVNYSALTSFIENASCGTGTPTSGTLYNLSPNGTDWYYWTGAAWGLNNSGIVADANPATGANSIASNLTSFVTQLGAGTIYFKTFLQSTGTSACVLNSVTISGIP